MECTVFTLFLSEVVHFIYLHTEPGEELDTPWYRITRHEGGLGIEVR